MVTCQVIQVNIQLTCQGKIQAMKIYVYLWIAYIIQDILRP